MWGMPINKLSPYIVGPLRTARCAHLSRRGSKGVEEGRINIFCAPHSPKCPFSRQCRSQYGSRAQNGPIKVRLGASDTTPIPPMPGSLAVGPPSSRGGLCLVGLAKSLALFSMLVLGENG
jgi:hypothetical protein